MWFEVIVGTLFPHKALVSLILNRLSKKIILFLFLFQCRVLLNLRTSQPFEEVLEDLGQVLKMIGAKKMYTSHGQEVRVRVRFPELTLT